MSKQTESDLRETHEMLKNRWRLLDALMRDKELQGLLRIEIDEQQALAVEKTTLRDIDICEKELVILNLRGMARGAADEVENAYRAWMTRHEI